jgi:hypothetical protein
VSYNPGDLGFCRASEGKGPNGATTTLGKLNQAGARVRYPKDESAWRWTHVFTVVSEDGAIVEATEHGVERNHISKYDGTDFTVVDVGQPLELRELCVRSALSRVGQPYRKSGYVTDAFQCLTGSMWILDFDGRENCSENASYNTHCYVGRYDRKPAALMPVDLAVHWRVHSTKPTPELGFVGKLLNALVLFVDLFRRKKGDPPPPKEGPSP